jgi:protein-S-isoprenylcysteine O-methyltransferase Ste14
MHTSRSKLEWQRGWVVGLALLSLIVPVGAVLLRTEPAVPFADPAHLSYYRQTVAAIVLGLAAAAGAFVATRSLTPAWLRWAGVALASLGMLLGVLLLLLLIGSCGAGVILGVCAP